MSCCKPLVMLSGYPQPRFACRLVSTQAVKGQPCLRRAPCRCGEGCLGRWGGQHLVPWGARPRVGMEGEQLGAGMWHHPLSHTPSLWGSHHPAGPEGAATSLGGWLPFIFLAEAPFLRRVCTYINGIIKVMSCHSGLFPSFCAFF